MSEEENEDPRYRIDIDQQGCPTCHAGRTYTIVGPDGVTALGRPWDDMDEALEWADELNAAYDIGFVDGKTSPTERRAMTTRAKPKTRREERRAIEPTCRICGCTEWNACMTVLGPCAWVVRPGKDNLGLCTACE